MKIKEQNFGRLKDGQEVIKYLLINDQLQVNVLNYGGIITEIYAPDQKGRMENIVLGYDNLEDYVEKSPYFGAIIGRHAGRIGNAEFTLKGKTYELAHNDGQNNLHGGKIGLDKKIWNVKEIKNGIELTYFSPHLEEGFPANVEFVVKYLLKDNELIIEYQAKPDRETIINLTNHTYFNLSGNTKKDILSHQLMIEAEEFLALNQESIPTGEVKKVKETPFDFRDFKKVGQEIKADYKQLTFTDGYDHPFILKDTKESIILKEEESKRALSITTDQPIAVFYAGNQLANEGLLNSGVQARKRLGLCLETQDYPNAINVDNFPTKTYTPNQIYTARTKYKFDL
ncbi:galactose mutarotase-like enzyme [Halobacteroides halobius DSM 5150]|uniref:Aldose 1-epimerase n=1 Tax=Halobacteroides halobius (strain ATCC 35273 / DSM 5150 / MD-1) TaxID=748449 RepID=L0K9Q2_HALHC|nr:aldose epimerase family protein [Halobacteroides halobius]AGB41265.1 galactose mutarotase-like enzyme [Halobacteroides halobius DSM 5150]